MPKSACPVLVFMLSLVLPSAAAAQLPQPVEADVLRVAYVSPERVFYESNHGKAAQARLASLETETSRDLEARQAKLKALQDGLAERASVLGEAARREREVEIDRFQIDLQRFVEDAQAQFLGVRRDLESAFLARFVSAVDSIAKTRGLLFVVNEGSGVLAWADPKLDITADVIEAVDQP